MSSLKVAHFLKISYNTHESEQHSLLTSSCGVQLSGSPLTFWGVLLL